MPAARRFFTRFLLYAALLPLAVALAAFAGAFAKAGFSEPDDLGLSLGTPQKEALLTIFYDASTYGMLHPCPT